ncbi:MAG: LamG-like jellyroll fold domain-containing protein [Verrucomicrobiota bacterium]
MKADALFRFASKTIITGFAACCAALMQEQTAWATPTVVGLWRFNEGSGVTISDSSGLGNNGTLQGDNGNLPIWTNGQSGFGSALLFTNDGVNHTYVNVLGSPSLMIGQTATNAWTITAWAYENSDGSGDFAATYGRIMVIDDGYAFQLESGAVGDGELYTWSEDNLSWQIGWAAYGNVTPLLDQWEHWAVVYDGTNLSVYRNGNQGPSAGTASLAVTAALGYVGYQGAILIGSELDDTADRNWNGMLDDVAVFAGALTQDQIDTVMSGDFSAFIGGPAGIVSQPQSVTAKAGTIASFSVGAYGAQPLSYQWFLNQTNLVTNGVNATLTLNNLLLNQAGAYSVVVSNASGVVTSQPAVLTIYPGNLVGLWRFNQGSGTTALDSSGLGNNGTLVGSNGVVPVWTNGQSGFGSSVLFTNDGADYDYVGIAGNDSLQIGQTATNGWTITAWAYEDSEGTGDFVATYGRILVIDDGTALQLESGASGDAEFYVWSRANPAWQLGWSAYPAVTPLLDQWEHVAVVYDGTNITLYLNGNQGPKGGVASQPITAAVGYPQYEGSILIGSELAQPASRNWNGMLDDVAVFNVALSQAQIQAVMAGDFSAFISPPPLSISVTAGQVSVSWPVTAPTFQVQSTTNLSGAVWSSVATTPTLSGNTLTVTLPGSATTEYFRLVGP